MLTAWLATAAVFLILDAGWLSLTSASLYRPVLQPLLRVAGPRLVPAALFYLIYITGAVVLAVRPALHAGGWRRAGVIGALLGVFAYATYDLTNEATLAVWSVRITALDLAWGCGLTALASAAGCAAASRVGKS